jgi:amino acid transporter
MIQRIQTVFLLLTTITGVLFLSGDLVSLSNSNEGQVAVDISESVYIAALIVLVSLISFITIFFYRKRKVQLRLTTVSIVLNIILILALAYYIYHFTAAFGLSLVPGLNLLYPLLMLIFLFLAYRGIKKDEEIVKSYDRLR